jgi:imidazolonepropionase-like amidohydrolase
MPRPRRDITRLLEEVAAGGDIYGLKPRRKIMDLAFVKDVVHQKMRNLKLLSDNGILLGAASDAGVHMMMGILPDELCRMTAAGLSNARALRSATVDAAKLLRVDDVGRIKRGYRGDFVLYDGNPLEDIEVVRKPSLVIRDGVPQIPGDREGLLQKI